MSANLSNVTVHDSAFEHYDDETSSNQLGDYDYQSDLNDEEALVPQAPTHPDELEGSESQFDSEDGSSDEASGTDEESIDGNPEDETFEGVATNPDLDSTCGSTVDEDTSGATAPCTQPTPALVDVELLSHREESVLPDDLVLSMQEMSAEPEYDDMAEFASIPGFSDTVQPDEDEVLKVIDHVNDAAMIMELEDLLEAEESRAEYLATVPFITFAELCKILRTRQMLRIQAGNVVENVIPNEMTVLLHLFPEGFPSHDVYSKVIELMNAFLKHVEYDHYCRGPCKPSKRSPCELVKHEVDFDGSLCVVTFYRYNNCFYNMLYSNRFEEFRTPQLITTMNRVAEYASIYYDWLKRDVPQNTPQNVNPCSAQNAVASAKPFKPRTRKDRHSPKESSGASPFDSKAVVGNPVPARVVKNVEAPTNPKGKGKGDGRRHDSGKSRVQPTSTSENLAPKPDSGKAPKPNPKSKAPKPSSKDEAPQPNPQMQKKVVRNAVSQELGTPHKGSQARPHKGKGNGVAKALPE